MNVARYNYRGRRGVERHNSNVRVDAAGLVHGHHRRLKISSNSCARCLHPHQRPPLISPQHVSPFSRVDPIGRKFDRDVVGAELKHHRYRLTRVWPLCRCCVWRYFVKSRAAESRDAVVNWELFRRKFPLRSVGWKP